MDRAIREIAARVTLLELPEPTSHTVIEAAGLDDQVVAESLARYAVGFLAGWVQRDATISGRLGIQGVDRRAEVHRLVARIVEPPGDVDDERLANWRHTWRDGWIAEILTHVLFVIRRSIETDCLRGNVVALMRPHPLPKRQGLDTVALYDEQGVAVLTVGETKASARYGSRELDRACDIFDSVDAGLAGPDLRDALDSLADVLPEHLIDQVSDDLWRNHRCYVPSIVHQDAFDARSERERLGRLLPVVDRKRVLLLNIEAFDSFFDRVADAMPQAVNEIVV